MDSQRLPGKALRHIAGRPLLGHVLDRVREVPGGPVVVVATTARAIDDPIHDFANGEGVLTFRGATEDVLGRAVACAHAFHADQVIRVSGDSPFFSAQLAADMLEVADSFPFDLVTNVHPRTYPRGLSIEIITTTALELAAGATAEPDDREHVTRYFYRNAAHFRIKNIASGQPEYASLELAVDCEADRARAAWIFEHISSHPPRLDELVTLARAWQGCSEPTASTA